MRKCHILLIILCCNLLLHGQSVLPERKIYLNEKNLVYLIFDTDIDDIMLDKAILNTETFEGKRNTIAVRYLNKSDTTKIGGMVMLKNNIFQPIEFFYIPQIKYRTETFITKPTIVPIITSDAVVSNKTNNNLEELTKFERDSLFKADSKEIKKRNKEVIGAMLTKSEGVIKKPDKILLLQNSKQSINIALCNIGVDAEHLYLVVECSNNSNIDYYIDMQGFMISNKRKGITAGNTGKMPLNIIASYNEPTVLRSKKAYRYILVYELFTLKNNQNLEFFLRETNGGRDIEIEVPSKYLYENTIQL